VALVNGGKDSDITVQTTNSPLLSGAGNAVAYTEAGPAATIDSGLTVSDPGSTTLAGASVSIGTGFFAGDVLMAVTTGTAITASYNAGTGALSLSGTDSPADYQQVLRSVTFSSTSQNPTNFGADISRTIGWLASDGAQSSNTVFSTVNVFAVDNAPVLGGAGNNVTFTTGGPAIVIDSGLIASDVDNQNLAGATVSITAGLLPGDMLNFVNPNGISGIYNAATGVLTLSGSASVANYPSSATSPSEPWGGRGIRLHLDLMPRDPCLSFRLGGELGYRRRISLRYDDFNAKRPVFQRDDAVSRFRVGMYSCHALYMACRRPIESGWEGASFRVKSS
jgi:hypothetical protein